MRLACANVRFDSFTNAIIDTLAQQKTRWFRIQGGHSHADLEYDGLDCRGRRPAGVGKKLRMLVYDRVKSGVYIPPYKERRQQ